MKCVQGAAVGLASTGEGSTGEHAAVGDDPQVIHRVVQLLDESTKHEKSIIAVVVITVTCKYLLYLEYYLPTSTYY